jgi:predicted benzoate:H+ symporter BenE
MSTNQGQVLAYVFSFVGGLIVLVASVLNVFWFGSGAPNWSGYGGYMRGMMDGNHGFMGAYGSSNSFFALISALSLISGVIVLVSAVLLRVRPQENAVWATLIIAFSIVSFVGMGGYFIGAVFGIVGGALALGYKPRT